MRPLLKLSIILALGTASFAIAQTNRPLSERGRERLEREVRRKLVLLPYYGAFDNFEFRVDGGRVTLMGQVTRPVLKSDAERAVKKIEGVESIDNRIEVLPLSPNDDRIRNAFQHSGIRSLEFT